MANNYKAKPTNLLSISNTTHQQKLKSNAAITNELANMVSYLLSVYQNPDLKDNQRMLAVKQLWDIKKALDSDLQVDMSEARDKATEEAKQAIEEEREKVPVQQAKTPEEISAALAEVRRLFYSENEESEQ